MPSPMHTIPASAYRRVVGASIAALPALLLGAAPSAFAQSPLHRIDGVPPFEEFGRSVSRVGDVDGDGYPDVLFGAPRGTVGFADQGRVVVLSGHTGIAIHILAGTDWNDRFGTSVAAAGDVDQDGRADILIGAVGDDHSPSHPGCQTGAARIHSGLDGSLIREFHGDSCGDEMGRAVGYAGDVDADGYPDQIVGITTGKARVFSGLDGSVLHTFQGQAPGDRFGWAVDGAGDVNQDGHDDLLVGAEAGNYVKLFSGADGSVLRTWSGVDFFGCSVAGIGDVDQDGIPDVAVGAWADDSPTHSNAGAVHWFSGASGSLIRSSYGDGSSHYLGTSVRGGVDVDADGWPDVIAGAPNARPHPSDPNSLGEARVYSGFDGSILFTTHGTDAGGEFGSAVDLVGDVDGDGRGDLVVGEFEFGVSGRGHVFAGACLPPVTYCTAKVNSQGCIPTMDFTGLPSITGADDFHIRATNVLGRKLGLMFWSLREDNAPSLGGTRCVYSVVRTTAQNSGGNQGPDCSGNYDFHFSQAYMASKGIFAGMTLHAQYYSRDPGFPPPNNMGLTNGLRFTVCP